MSQESLQKLVTELDVLIRARYPLIAANTHEEGRFKRVMHAVAQLQNRRIQDHDPDKKDKEKGLYLWSRTTGLCQTIGADLKRVAIMQDPNVRARILSEDPISGSTFPLIRRLMYTQMFRFGNPPNYMPKRDDSIAAMAFCVVSSLSWMGHHT